MLATTLPGFVDVWHLLHGPNGKDKGYTFDAAINTLLERPRPDERMRYDRVMARMGAGGKGKGWWPVGMEVLGREPMEDGLFLSDHFGLLATFAPAPAPEEEGECV